MKKVLKVSNKAAALLLAAVLGAGSVPFAVTKAQAADVSIAAVTATLTTADASIRTAVENLIRLGVLDGYEDHSIRENTAVSRAELAKMIVHTFGLAADPKATTSLSDVAPDAWYSQYAATLVSLGIMEAKDGKFNPQGTVTDAELVQIVAKALKRDVKSVNSWMGAYYSASEAASRGETSYVLNTAHQAIPSAEANITSVQSLNAITLIVTLDAPLTADNELFAKAKEDFAFNDGLTLTNMPRLKTGSIATYIVPTSVQKAGTNYQLTYRGKQAGTFTGNGTKLDTTGASQVTNDTFELEALKANGVVDYGYVISAYSAGRGNNAFVLGEDHTADGRKFQVISSMQAREVTITPEGGQPIVAKYVPFTQSTDGKQEPKFRLPEGQSLTPGVKYTVTSDWTNIANPSFVAKEIASLQLAGATAGNETSIEVALSADPGDELFSGRSVQLTAPNGDKLNASYRYSSRKGAVGVFDLTQNSKLAAGTTYTVAPVGAWATAAAPLTLTTK
ncbi:S-layer homology domain-containing protein [Paenibacillus ginsengarvi]|uniref:S-layer homology domain-containing protein n=1 Tax=Paenibacillus ginsengarvi TaxID=400777 RepID=A0A3B0CLH0_9BACL|nr:S-layer homology domain-containing protein [Paenibacillus ginsengarvi]RKN85374.1 S-layer homology domain-containing protein [Paenibacillus ginsengarvi]